MADLMSEEQINEYKEVFSLFDMLGEGNIPTKDFSVVMRALGMNVTEAEVNELLKEADQKADTMDFNEFLNLIAKKLNDQFLGADDVISSFKVFDKENNGKVEVAELKHVMTKMGEHLTDKEFNDVMADFEKDENGCVDYEHLVRTIMPF